MPLTVPPDDPALTAAVALRFPSTQLFTERATARGARFDLRDADAAIVAASAASSTVWRWRSNWQLAGWRHLACVRQRLFSING